jgi:hypothetical protein
MALVMVIAAIKTTGTLIVIFEHVLGLGEHVELAFSSKENHRNK